MPPERGVFLDVTRRMHLLKQRWTNQDGPNAPVTLDDILVVSPYNMQVNLLQSMLPKAARVGTVDKFQGQEAVVVILSMTTFSAEDAPRGMEFLFSRNRLNVAISRPRALAIVVASSLLLEALCRSVEQVKLVNTLCFARHYADARTHRTEYEVKGSWDDRSRVRETPASAAGSQ